MADRSVWQTHRIACEAGRASYVDPDTGYQVFTRVGLLARGQCCGAGCRHCPYAHEAVDPGRRAEVIQQAAWLTKCRPPPAERLNLLFWSGGKDSFLAYRALQSEDAGNTVLLTTFDAATGVIAHQGIHIDVVVAQAKYLDVALIGVPLHAGRSYMEHLLPAFKLVPNCSSLSFGDLHLEHIRRWREREFGSHGETGKLHLLFPLWNVPYDSLLDELERSGVCCLVSSVAEPDSGVSVGEVFDRTLVARLPEGIDAFGENGEFHTRVVLE